MIDFVRGLSTVRFAGLVGIEEYRDREQARVNRDSVTEALDGREADANTRVFRSLRQLRAAVVEHVREELLRLPPVIVATPASVQPSLAIAYDIYEDIWSRCRHRGADHAATSRLRACEPDHVAGGVGGCSIQPITIGVIIASCMLSSLGNRLVRTGLLATCNSFAAPATQIPRCRVDASSAVT